MCNNAEIGTPQVTFLLGLEVLRNEGDSESSQHGYENDEVEDEGEDDISVSEEGRELLCLENDYTPLDITPSAMSEPWWVALGTDC